MTVTTGSMRWSRAFRQAPCPARRRSGRWRSSPSWKTAAAASMPARWDTSISRATSISASRFERSSSRTGAPTCRPAPASSPTRIPVLSTKRRATRLAQSSARWSWRRQDCRAHMILVIDNYDSFTYNLVQYLGELGAEMRVIRNDEATVDEIESEMKPERILISPGPGTPDTAGISLGAIERFAGKLPILGVCLGHQAIGQHFGGKVVRAPQPVHGKPVVIDHDGKTIFSDIPNSFEAGRYHSLIVDRDGFPDELEISAESPDGLIMGV